MERWEAAAPLVDGVLAEDIGKASERRLTAEVVRDLRVPVYACELLFVRDCEAGRALVEAWSVEASFDSGLRPSAQDAAPRNDRGAVRLAFLRALYRVKPRFLALPRSWLRAAPVGTQPTVRRMAQAPTALVHVEIAPGRYVCCLPGEEEKYRERFARMRAGRR